MRVLLRADSGLEQGTGHVMRMLTLAQALRESGHEAVLATAATPVAWLREHLAASGLEIHLVTPDSLAVPAADAGKYDVLVFDGYRFDPRATRDALSQFTTTLAVVDGDRLEYSATLYLDQNPGAQAEQALSDRYLLGPTYALIREEMRIQRARGLSARGLQGLETPRILAVLGGSDPFGAAQTIYEVLQLCQVDFTATLIDASAAANVELGFDSRIHVTPPVQDLPRRIGECTFAISAAGTTSLDLLACGAPTALVCVAGNQAAGYAGMVAAGLALPLGRLELIRSDIGVAAELLDGYLKDLHLQSTTASRAATTVDGLGAMRVVAALEDSVRASDDFAG